LLLKEGGPLPFSFSLDNVGMNYKLGTNFKLGTTLTFFFGTISSTAVPNYPVLQLNTGVTLVLVFSEPVNTGTLTFACCGPAMLVLIV
tara:strand:+ start:117 stop:380 length:264 start_codon:yes stop_codon:yes gene_type:complete